MIELVNPDTPGREDPYDEIARRVNEHFLRR